MISGLGSPQTQDRVLRRQNASSRANGVSMDRPLTGRLILIAEDEPLIALEMTLAFEDEGALVVRAHTLKEARLGVEDPALSAAILDHALSDGDSTEIRERMKERNIPFVIFSGYDQLDGGCDEGVHVKKPASMSVLVATVKGLLAEHS
jgi:DNA-binding response OmpR family regulator